ncbi:hypothetical protein RI129_011175 [Pyrocoelia pectoralis]|uniref:Ionotropic glutamate receptor C-terminal domain-containing protein n=1 Tax=Pyrocoelia pectoralis TaxID=417401 RepID=A0AAN7VAP4_9COLE
MFVKWICVQILSAQCDAFINYLNATDVSTKVCIKKTINHLFSYDDTLSLILDNDMCEEAIFEMNTTRPYISLNLETVEGIQLQYEGQFIICPRNDSSLIHTVRRMEYVAVMNRRGLGNFKILVITNTIGASRIFRIFWHYGINNVIFLSNEQGISKLYMSDRYSPANVCGKTVKSIIHQNCEDQLTFSFTNLIHQMNKCPIQFLYTERDRYLNEEHYPDARYILYVIQELSNRRNATFQRILYNHDSELMIYARNKTNVVMTHTDKEKECTATEPLVTDGIVWLVPKAEPVSDMNAVAQVFKWNVWVAIGVTLICTWLTWFLIISWNNGRFTFEKLGLAFMNVWSLTICGCIAQFPRSFALRITLLCYLFYVIHIQCALTSNMATILTRPRYGYQIRNLEELVESELPIYILESLKLYHFDRNNSDHKFYTRLQKRLHPVPDGFKFSQLIVDLNHYRNYAAVVLSDDVRNIAKEFSKKIDIHEIHDNSVTGDFTVRLALPKDHYFAPTLNSLLSKIVESGIDDKLKSDFEHECFPKNLSMEVNDKVLNLPHLAFIFVFLGFGLSISCVVFCLELVVHKFL